MINFYKQFFKIINSIILLVFVLLTGIIGFRFYLDHSWVDSIYMTVITMSTVGFGQARDLDDNGKLFTVFLIIFSIVLYTYSITIITNYIINIDFIRNYKKKKMLSKIKELKGHTIICGFGRTGMEAFRRLKNYNKKIVVIEKLKEKKELSEFDDNKSFFIAGDVLDDNILDLVNISEAGFIISTMSSDADNLLLVLSARQKNKNARIISRALNINTVDKLKFAGADNVILPEILGGNRMASIVISKDIVEFLDDLIINDNSFNLSEIDCNNLPQEFINKSIKELEIRQKTNCQVIGIKKHDNSYIINPSAESIIEKGMKLITIGSEEQIQKLNKLFNNGSN